MNNSSIIEILQDLYPDSQYKISDTLYQDFNKMTYHAENANKKDSKVCKIIFAFNITPENMNLYSNSINIIATLMLDHIILSTFNFDGFLMILYTVRDYSNFVVDKCLDPSLLPFTDLFLDIIYGIRSIHSCGLLNGNISPSNIVFNEDYRFSLCDSFENYLWPNRKVPAIKYRYISPEILNEKESTEMCDIWSYGCLVYYCLTGGKNAFNGNNNDELPLSIINRNFDMLNEYDNSDLYIPIIKGTLNIKPYERMTVNEIVIYLEALNNKENIIPYNTVNDIRYFSYIDLLFFNNFYFNSLRYNDIDVPYSIIEYVMKNKNERKALIDRFLYGNIKSITDYIVYINYCWHKKYKGETNKKDNCQNPISYLIPIYYDSDPSLYIRPDSLNPSYKYNVKFLSYSFFGLKQMTRLVLKRCGIDYEGLKILTKEFKYLKSLEVLDMSDDHLTNESCIVLSEGLKYLKELREIFLTTNDFGEIGFAYLKEQLTLLTDMVPTLSIESYNFIKRMVKRSGVKASKTDIKKHLIQNLIIYKEDPLKSN